MKTPVDSGPYHRRLIGRFAAALLIFAALPSGAPGFEGLVELHRLQEEAGPLAATRGPAAILAAAPASATSADCPALLRHSFTRLQGGEPQSLCQYAGKVLLIVNTASYCGYTRQYEGLEALYRRYQGRGLVVVGFPSHDFNQEPGSNAEIAEFCRTTYGVQFPMFEKQSVTRLAANPLYAELAAKTGEQPRWNFHKYVVDRSGTEVASFKSSVEPDDKALTGLIERLLAEKPARAGG